MLVWRPTTPITANTLLLKPNSDWSCDPGPGSQHCSDSVSDDESHAKHAQRDVVHHPPDLLVTKLVFLLPSPSLICATNCVCSRELDVWSVEATS
jgi:hypothetical protein